MGVGGVGVYYVGEGGGAGKGKKEKSSKEGCTIVCVCVDVHGHTHRDVKYTPTKRCAVHSAQCTSSKKQSIKQGEKDHVQCLEFPM